jgi:hypothetical protein
MTSGFFLFSLICGVLWYGVVKRKIWMWFAGWLCLLLYSGVHFLASLYTLSQSASKEQITYSVLHFLGGLVFLLGGALCWFSVRSKFIPKK